MLKQITRRQLCDNHRHCHRNQAIFHCTWITKTEFRHKIHSRTRKKERKNKKKNQNIWTKDERTNECIILSFRSRKYVLIHFVCAHLWQYFMFSRLLNVKCSHTFYLSFFFLFISLHTHTCCVWNGVTYVPFRTHIREFRAAWCFQPAI